MSYAHQHSDAEPRRRSWSGWFRTAIACALALLLSRPPAWRRRRAAIPKARSTLLPYGAGGVGDQTIACWPALSQRETADRHRDRPSAGGIISMTEVLRAAADGYTLARSATARRSACPVHQSALRLAGTSADFGRGQLFHVLAVPDRSPYKSLAQLCRSRPQETSSIWGRSIGNTQNLSAHLSSRSRGWTSRSFPIALLLIW